MSKVTIKTVAELAKVSIKTVSRVINKESNVRSSTRSRVLAVINELDYIPSPAARALASNHSKMIGLVYLNPSDAYILAAQTGALKTCYANGYNLVIHPCDYEPDQMIEELISLAKESRLDGLILTPPITDNQNIISSLLMEGVNIVSISPTSKNSEFSSVSCNDAEIVQEMTEHLLELGHTRIGFIHGHVDHGAAYKRFEGYKTALKNSNLPLLDSLVMQGDFSYESGVKSGRKLLGYSEPPTAIIASNDYMAAGVLSAAYELGISIPDSLSLVGFDDSPVSRQVWPLLTTVKQPVYRMAEAAAKLLIKKINSPNKKAEHKVISAEVIFRDSTAALKK